MLVWFWTAEHWNCEAKGMVIKSIKAKFYTHVYFHVIIYRLNINFLSKKSPTFFCTSRYNCMNYNCINILMELEPISDKTLKWRRNLLLWLCSGGHPIIIKIPSLSQSTVPAPSPSSLLQMADFPLAIPPVNPRT